MELIDVLNKKGEVIGVKSRKEIMKNGDLHRTVHIWIINEFNEILLQKRNPKKDTYPNLWAISTAGHVITNETSKEAAIRELKEELNLNIKEEELEYLFTIERKQEFKDMKIHCFDDVYLLKYNLNIEKTKLQKSELTDLIFINYKELQEIYKNNDPKFVPATEEHDKLFKYLEKKLKDSDLVFKTKIIHTYEECLKACAFTLRHEIIITSLLFLASIVGLFGIFKNIKIFYYAIIFIMLLITFINAKAKKKTKQV